METGADRFTAQRAEKLRQEIDFSDIPEITDMTGFKPRNLQPAQNAQPRQLGREAAALKRGEGQA